MKLLNIISIYILRTTLALAVLFISFAIFYWFNNRLTLLGAKIIWPQKNFNESEFKNGGPQERSSMAVDLIEKKKYIGAECRNIPELLGQSTGDYYHQDGNHTYRLTERESADWILTFVCDNNGTVGDIFIRKSCCSISQKMLFSGLELVDPLLQSLLRNRSK